MCLSLLISTSYATSIQVSPLELNFFPGQTNHKTVTVSNLTDHTIYLRVGLFRVAHPGTKKRRLVTLENDPLAFGLVVSQRKLVIPPHQLRRLHVIRLHSTHRPPKQDWVYQINITPISGQLIKTKSSKVQYAQGLKIIVAYGIRVVLRPKKPIANIVLIRHGKQVTAMNKGNTTALLINGRQCQSNNKHCQYLGVSAISHRLFAGNVWHFTIPKALPVTFTQLYITQKKTIHSN